MSQNSASSAIQAALRNAPNGPVATLDMDVSSLHEIEQEGFLQKFH
jgi:hypothetical protein